MTYLQPRSELVEPAVQKSNNPTLTICQIGAKLINSAQKALTIKNVVNLLVLTYLLSLLLPIKLGQPLKQNNVEQPKVERNNKFASNEIGIIVILLLANSNILERITQLKLGKDGVEFQVEKLHNNIDANRSASQRESSALSFLGGLLIENDKEKREFFDILLDDGDLEMLEYLFEAEKKNSELHYEKQEKQYLKHLYSLNFIEPQATKAQIYSMPEQGNVRQYFKVSDWGKFCLRLGSSKAIPKETDINLKRREIWNKIVSNE